VRDRFGLASAKAEALELCQKIFVADGARSDEQGAVLQNVRKLLE